MKKLRRKKIQSYEAANEYMEADYLPEHNRRFAREAAAVENYHRKRPSKKELDEVFRLETKRTIGNDWVVRHDNRFFQVRRQSRYAPAKANVVVCEWEEGRLEIRYRGKPLIYEEIPARPVTPLRVIAKTRRQRRAPAPPPASHPWKEGYQQMRPRRRTVQ